MYYLCIPKWFEVDFQIISQFLVGRIQLLSNEVYAVRAQTLIVHLNGEQILGFLTKKKRIFFIFLDDKYIERKKFLPFSMKKKYQGSR